MGSESPPDRQQIDTRPFTRADTLNRFCCGQAGIDRWLKNNAKKHSDRDQVRVFMAYVSDDPFPIGFYALKVADERTAVFAQSPDDYTKNLASFGVLHLAYLAVNESYQNQGVGTFLLGDAISKSYEILKLAGFYALTLQSISAETTTFYKKLNFTAYDGEAERPKMMLLAQNIRALMEPPPAVGSAS